MESVNDIMKKNKAQWAKEWPFDPIVDFGSEPTKTKTEKKSKE